MSFKDHFSRIAARYSAFRPSYPPALFDYLAGLCGPGSRVWDCACGTGQAALGLAERFDSVIATDASSQQIEAATANPKITYRVSPAPAQSSGLGRDAVDLVTVAQAEKHGVDPVVPLEEKLASLWRESVPRVVTWPLTMRVGRK
jgi:2-polyprenyl-3-methyl-5-hydroxy-6-metoxy-1,4-benzoquinol methylase